MSSPLNDFIDLKPERPVFCDLSGPPLTEEKPVLMDLSPMPLPRPIPMIPAPPMSHFGAYDRSTHVARPFTDYGDFAPMNGFGSLEAPIHHHHHPLYAPPSAYPDSNNNPDQNDVSLSPACPPSSSSLLPPSTLLSGLVDDPCELERSIQDKFLRASGEEREHIYNRFMSHVHHETRKLNPEQLQEVRQAMPSLGIDPPYELLDLDKPPPVYPPKVVKGKRKARSESQDLDAGAKRKPRKSRKVKDDDPLRKGGPIQSEMARLRKSRMAFQKGTFLIRLSEAEAHRDDRVWCVDNHQLLLRYNFESSYSDQIRVYRKTDRYTGWLCDEPWHYFPINDVRRHADPDKIALRYPSRDALEEHGRKQQETHDLEIMNRERDCVERAAMANPALMTVKEEPAEHYPPPPALTYHDYSPMPSPSIPKQFSEHHDLAVL